jgi:hypothetical protein
MIPIMIVEFILDFLEVPYTIAKPLPVAMPIGVAPD